MYRRIGLGAFLAVAALIAVATVFWPTAALLVRTTEEAFDEGGIPAMLNSRQAVLLAKSVGTCAIAALLCVGFSVPAAMLLDSARGPIRFITLLCLSAVLLCPPMVYTFGWQGILPTGVPGWALCMFIWAAWAWPLAAFLLAPGLQSNRGAIECALLEVGRVRAFLFVTVPALRPYALTAAIAALILFLGDYSVPHACGQVVYATEILGWASNSTRAIDTLAPALPGAAVILATLVVLCFVARNTVSRSPDRLITPGTATVWCTVVLVAITWLVPLGALIARLESPAAIPIAIHTYARDTAWTFLSASAAGIVVCVLAIATAGWRRAAYAWAAWTAAIGVLPGALLGKALVTAYNRAPMSWFYDSWLIVTAGHVARFAWLGAIVGLLLSRDLRSTIADQAALDGAGRWSALFRVFLPARRGLLASLTLIVVALSLGEAATTSLVRIPAFAPVSLVLIEKFHRLEDEMLISLSLLLIAVSLPTALGIAWTWRRAG